MTDTQDNKTLKQVIGRIRYLRLSPCASTLLHHFLYQCLYFGDGKVVNGEAISFSCMKDTYGYSRSNINTALKKLKEKHILLHNDGDMNTFGNIYHINSNVDEWIIDIASTENSTDTSTENSTTSTENSTDTSTENSTDTSTENSTQQTVLPNSITKQDYINIYGEFENVKLTENEYEKLVDRFGELDALERIEALSSGKASKGYKYKSDYAAILSWSRKDKKQGNKITVITGNAPSGAFDGIEERELKRNGEYRNG
jgi:hypothetical protein